MNIINDECNRICKMFCNGIEYCPTEEYCEYVREIRKNIIKVIIKSNDETDE